MLAATSHAQACDIRAAIEGKRISLQAWGIIPKIAEVDAGLLANPSWRGRVREVHPELCFAMLAPRPMMHAKKVSEGRAERLRNLQEAMGVTVEAMVTTKPRPLRRAEDDIVDALVALWTARRIREGVEVCTPREPPVDATGLRMEMLA